MRKTAYKKEKKKKKLIRLRSPHLFVKMMYCTF
jgi:hypothetical protein